MRKLYYIYTHIRKDTGNIFYVGMSFRYENVPYYSRAYIFNEKKRNHLWQKQYCESGKDIVVTILYESFDEEAMMNLEKYLIRRFSKKRFNTGVLANIAEGGALKNKPAFLINQFSSDGVYIKTWKSVTTASKSMGISDKTIYQSISEKGLVKGLYLFKNFSIEDKYNNIAPYMDRRVKG